MSFTGHRKQEVMDAVNAAAEAIEHCPDNRSTSKMLACLAIAAFACSMGQSECARYGAAHYEVMASDIEGLAG